MSPLLSPHPEHGWACVQGCEPGASVGGGSLSALWVCLGTRMGTRPHSSLPCPGFLRGTVMAGGCRAVLPSLIRSQVLTLSPADTVTLRAWPVASRGCQPEGHQLGKLWGVGA